MLPTWFRTAAAVTSAAGRAPKVLRTSRKRPSYVPTDPGVMLTAWLMMKIVQASARVGKESWGVSARKQAINPTSMHSQVRTLRTPAVARRPGDRSEASPLRTDAEKRSMNAPTRGGKRVAIRSITANVLCG
jgi:hypothetical protein